MEENKYIQEVIERTEKEIFLPIYYTSSNGKTIDGIVMFSSIGNIGYQTDSVGIQNGYIVNGFSGEEIKDIDKAVEYLIECGKELEKSTETEMLARWDGSYDDW